MPDRRLVAALACLGVVSAAEGRQAAPGLPPAKGEPPGHSFRLPDDRIGRRISPILLLSREDVCSDLKLDARQTAEAKQAMGELYERAAALRGQVGPEVVERRREIDRSCEGWIRQYLSETQQVRLVQIGLQWEGAAALATQPTLAEQVGLTAEQKRRLADAVTLRDTRRAAGIPVVEAEHELTASTLEMLKPAQEERWKAMLGPPFEPTLTDPAVRPAAAAAP